MQEKGQNISPIKQRILHFAANLGISKREFYAKIGVSRGTLESKTGITEDVITKFFATYPEVSIEWLMTGRGDMLRIASDFATMPPKSENVSVAIPADSSQQGIPLIPLSAMAGVFTGEQTILEYECERYVVPAFKGADFLIQVKGNSMYPTYNSGDIVACQRVPMSDIFFQWNKSYVLDTNQGAIIKRVKPGSDKEHILIVSDNKEYDPFELTYEDVHNIALVVGVIRLE